MDNSTIYDPQRAATPSQKSAISAYRERRERIAARAKPDAGVSCPSASQRGGISGGPKKRLERAKPMLFSEWLERQERLNPLPKPPWFSIESEIDAPPRRITVKDIQLIVAKFYRVTLNDINCKRRQGYLIRPRHVAMFLAKEITPCSLVEIGRRFGRRDHTTVLHAVKKIERLLLVDPALASEVETLRARISELT